MHQIVCWLGLCPRPPLGELTALPQNPLAGLVVGAPGEREGGRAGEKREGMGGEGVLECPNSELASLHYVQLCFGVVLYCIYYFV